MKSTIHQFPSKTKPESCSVSGTSPIDCYLTRLTWFIKQGRLSEARRLFNYGLSEGFPEEMGVPEDVLLLLEEAIAAEDAETERLLAPLKAKA
jgi:hypothetical protein